MNKAPTVTISHFRYDCMEAEIAKLKESRTIMMEQNGQALLEQHLEIAELKAKVDALQFSLDEVGTRNLKADAIREMLEATEEHMVLKDVDGEGYLSTKVIKAHADNLEKSDG